MLIVNGVFAIFTILYDSRTAPFDVFVAVIFKLFVPPSPSMLYPPLEYVAILFV